MFWKNNEDDNNKENDFYNQRSHQDKYFKDVFDRRNNLQYCRFCDCYRTFEWDRCKHCGNN
jgi:hypothetical protein